MPPKKNNTPKPKAATPKGKVVKPKAATPKTASAGFAHPIFAKLHGFVENVKIYPSADGEAIEWSPLYNGPEPDCHHSYLQCCDACHGAFETLDMPAFFCPWCGVEIPAPDMSAPGKVLDIDQAVIIANERARLFEELDTFNRNVETSPMDALPIDAIEDAYPSVKGSKK